MTSLGRLVFIDHNHHHGDNSCMTVEDQRLTLAYENLEEMPYNLMYNFGSFVKTLDISHNKFRCMKFLSQFDNLTSLILDHNEVDSETVFPVVPTLKLLWLNHNKVSQLFPFIRNLRRSFPNLHVLSLMGNAAAPSYLNGGSFYEYVQYRLFVISWFPDLVHLDDRAVTKDQKDEAHRLFKRPILERFSFSTSPSSYLRTFQDKLACLFNTVDQRYLRVGDNRNSLI